MTTQSETLPILLLRAREKAISYVRPVLADLDLTEQQWRVIRALFMHEALNTQQLAESTCILGPSLSRILAKLDSDGVIVRKADAADQRVVNIRLSAKGKRTHQRIFKSMSKQYQQFSSDMGAAKVEKLYNLLMEFVGQAD